MENFIELLKKYDQGTLSKIEEKAVLGALKNPQNTKIAKDFFADSHLLMADEHQFDTGSSLEEALARINFKDKSKSRKTSRITTYAIAASFALLFGFSFYYFSDTPETQSTIDVQDVVLELSDGTKKTLNTRSTESDSIVAISSVFKSWVSKGKLIYKDEDDGISKGMNKLHVPNGKNFSLQLADGSRVRLNAGSTLTYPVGFRSSKERRVYLDGEAFFEVAKDATKQFIVDTGSMTVAVLGTEFNVSSYQNDSFETVTLREGGVEVTVDSLQVNLKPNEQAMAVKGSTALEKRRVNINKVTGWLSGHLVFEKAPFREIALELERAFDVDIAYDEDELSEKRFTAHFENETVTEILDYLGKSYGFQASKDGNLITIE